MKPDIRARVRQLRARIGASPVIGSEIERRPLHDYRYWGDVFRIRELEARLVEIGRSGLAYWGPRAHWRPRDEPKGTRQPLP